MEYGHERLILWPTFAGDSGADEYVILTGDGDLYAEELKDWKEAILMTGISAYPTRGMPPYLVQFTIPLEVSDVLSLWKKGRAEARRVLALTPARKKADAPDSGYDWKGNSLAIPKATFLDGMKTPGPPTHRFRKKGPPDVGPPPGAAVFKPDADHVWLIAETHAGLIAGTEVELSVGCVVLGHKGIFLKGAVQAFVEQVKISDVADFVEAKKKLWWAPKPDGPPSSQLRGRLGLPAADGDGAAPAPAAVAAEEDDDVRTLWIDTDEHGIRKKEWSKVLVESWHEPFASGEGQRLKGPATTLQLMRVLEPDPRTWPEKWRQIKKLELNDRVMHELNTLIDAFQAGGSYDCLNMGSLLSFEILARRIYQVTDAYSIPGRISWANSKYFRGTASIDEVIPAEMRSYVNRESRTEVELASARARQQSFSGTAGAVAGAVDDDDAAGALLAPGDFPAGPGGKRGGRKGGGKGGGRFRQASTAAPLP